MPETSRNFLDKNIFDKNLSEEVYGELNEQNINNLYIKIKINSLNNHKS